jgi:hypothetical protein
MRGAFAMTILPPRYSVGEVQANSNAQQLNGSVDGFADHAAIQNQQYSETREAVRAETDPRRFALRANATIKMAAGADNSPYTAALARLTNQVGPGGLLDAIGWTG